MILIFCDTVIIINYNILIIYAETFTYGQNSKLQRGKNRFRVDAEWGLKSKVEGKNGFYRRNKELKMPGTWSVEGALFL